VSMDALDKLLVMCHAQALNLFVESYLKMVQKLLECNETDLQCLATSSVSTHGFHCDSVTAVFLRVANRKTYKLIKLLIILLQDCVPLIIHYYYIVLKCLSVTVFKYWLHIWKSPNTVCFADI